MGDFTRRGVIMGDNDESALGALLDALVEERVGSDFPDAVLIVTDDGWRMENVADEARATVFTACLRKALLHLLSPERFPPVGSVLGPVQRIAPEW